MDTATSVLERTEQTSADNEVHVYCPCNEAKTLCGFERDMKAPELPEDAEITCVVCDDLDLKPCEGCGF